MTLSLDHVVICVADLETAMADYYDLGFTVIYGGRHASGTTHNALICFADGTYLELMALTGEPEPLPDTADYSHLLMDGEGIIAYAFVSTDLEAEVAGLRLRGIDVDEVSEGGRWREDGVELRWRTAQIGSGMQPFLIEDLTPRYLRVPDDVAVTTHANGANGIGSLIVSLHPFTLERVAWFARLFGAAPEKLDERYLYSIYTAQIVLERAREKQTSYQLALAGLTETLSDVQKTKNVVFATLEDL